MHVGRTDGQSPSDAHATYVIPAPQRDCGRQLTIPEPSAATATQHEKLRGQSAGWKHGKSIFSQFSDLNFAGSMQVAFSGALVTQQTFPSSQTSDPHSSGPSVPASPPDSTGGVKSQLCAVPPRQQPAIAASPIRTAAALVPPPLTRVTPP